MTLTQKFLLTTVAAMVALVALLASLVSSGVASYVMSRNSGSTALYMQSFLEPHVQSMAVGGVLSPADFEALQDLADTVSLREHVISIKVWSPDGHVVFSTEPDIIGKQFPADDLANPLMGKVEAHLDELTEEENAFERQFDTPIFEIYVPLYDRTDGSVIAIGEFYEDATKLHSYLAQAALRNWLVLLPGALAILATLYLFFRHGARIIARQGAAIDAMKDDQEALTRENKAIEGNLAAARTQLRDIDELVRRRIGQELHDGPAQLLGYLTLSLENLTQVQRLKEIDSDALRAVQQAAERAQKEIRDISNRLLAAEPAGDKDETLSLRDIVAAYRERSHADVATQGLDLCDMLPRPAQRAIARIANEALNNGFKHAAAKGQQVLVAVRAGNLVVEIADDGPGLPDKATLARKADEGHRGLGGMAEQAGSIGAIIDLDSQPGQGTTVRITLPIA